MKCIKPLDLAHGAVSCGQCLPCRINRRRIWTGRLMLEALGHGDAVFVTLTYSEEEVPLLPGSGLQTLVPDDLTLFMKRLRKDHGQFRQSLCGSRAAARLRFFAVGEYGEQTFRPHYHAIIYGLSELESQTVAKAWQTKKEQPKGFIEVSAFNERRASYVAGYCTKKMVQEDDPRLRGRHPEFSRQSRRPGIGAKLIWLDSKKTIPGPLLETYTTKRGATVLAEYGDVLPEYRIDGKLYPLPDYWKRDLRKALGLPETLSEIRKVRPDAGRPLEGMPDAPELRHRWRRYEQKAKQFKEATKRPHHTRLGPRPRL